MTPQIKIELDKAAAELAARLGGKEVMPVVAAAMDVENLLTISHISEHRMRGNNGKSWPAELHVLGIRTNRYRQSLRHSQAQVNGSQVTGGIGSNVKYAGIHEFGGTIKIGARSGVARLRTDKSGNLLRQKSNAHLAVFARASHKQVKEVAFTAEAHEIEMPERRPVRSGIEDRAAKYGQGISKAIIEFWAGKN